MSGFDWTLFLVLSGMGMVGALAVMPYALETAGDKLSAAPLSRRTLILAGFVQSSVLILIATGIGLAAASGIGLGAPILSAAISGLPTGQMFVSILPLAVSSGLLTGLVIGVFDYYLFFDYVPESIRRMDGKMPVWKRLAASIYGGIDEEILTRLFLVSVLAWLFGRFWIASNGLPADGAYWIAIILSTLLFGLGHLPATRAMAPLTPALIMRALLLNGLAGVSFGWLFWQFGLEAAMLAHFSADLVIHIVYPRLGQKQGFAHSDVTANP